MPEKKPVHENKTDCCGPDGRAAGFEQIQNFVSSIRNGYKQFTVTMEKFEDGSRRLVLETNGKSANDPVDGGAESEPSVAGRNRDGNPDTSPPPAPLGSEPSVTDGTPGRGGGEGAEASADVAGKSDSAGVRLPLEPEAADWDATASGKPKKK